MPNRAKNMAGQAVSKNLSFGSRRPSKMGTVSQIWTNVFRADFDIEFFVNAGGGGGGAGFNNGVTAAGGGQGGGGGISISAAILSVLGVYTVTVGAGGAQGTYPSVQGGTGGTSSIVAPVIIASALDRNSAMMRLKMSEAFFISLGS